MSANGKLHTITYHYRGPIERGSNYRWTQGYSASTSEGYVLYPWMTRRECQRDARKQGCKAVFSEVLTGRRWAN